MSKMLESETAKKSPANHQCPVMTGTAPVHFSARSNRSRGLSCRKSAGKLVAALDVGFFPANHVGLTPRIFRGQWPASNQDSRSRAETPGIVYSEFRVSENTQSVNELPTRGEVRSRSPPLRVADYSRKSRPRDSRGVFAAILENPFVRHFELKFGHMRLRVDTYTH